MKPVTLFTAATGSYLLNCALGIGAATRVLDIRKVHGIHHAVYIATSTLAAAAVSSLVWSRDTAGWWLLPAVVPLALIPRISSHSRGHVVVALSAAPFFVASLAQARR